MSAKPYKEYYRDLYDLQNRVFDVLDESDFYLTGGTALSRFYLNHRYSDDPDFFVQKEENFLTKTRGIIAELKKHFYVETRIITTDYAKIFISSEKAERKSPGKFQTVLKIDFVNERDIPRFGKLNSFPLFPRVDNLRNILSNKVTAITRVEPKDVADIWCLCRKIPFDWRNIIYEAEQKEVIEELTVFQFFKTFPSHMLKKIRWVNPVNIEEFERDRETILQEILTKSPNTLYQTNAAHGGVEAIRK